MTEDPATYIKRTNKHLTKEDKEQGVPDSGSFSGKLDYQSSKNRDEMK